MAAVRPYLKKSIQELEALVEEKRHDPATLSRVSAELTHRESDRAARLRARVLAIRDGLELEVGAERSARPPDEPTLPGLSPTLRADDVEQAGGLSRTLPQGLFGTAPPAQPANSTSAEPETRSSSPEEASGRINGREQEITTAEMPEEQMIASPARSEPTIDDASPPIVRSRMIDLIDYVIAVEKDKLKIVTDVSDHNGFHRTHDELSGLPGVYFNRVDGEETAWLQVERLTKLAPPEPSEVVLRPWIVLFDDPEKEPRLRESLTGQECRDGGIALADGRVGLALLDYADAEAVKSAFAAYTSETWAEWSAHEKPRRNTIDLYGRLFALQRLLSASEGPPQEFVCGIGYAGLVRDRMRLRYPLLTMPLDIELDGDTHVISVVPREEVAPNVEIDPLDAMELPQVDAWRADARRVLEGLEDAPLSPFAPETYQSILRQAAALLDPRASYREGNAGEVLPPPIAGPELIITNAFGFFQRERRATQLMDDLKAFRGLLQGEEPVCIPGAVAALFTEPSSEVAGEDFPTFRGINSIPGVTSSDGAGTDLYFPKPFNAEQVQIAQRLAVRDGVVVQGPPGTGKTHTIANIISHYIAMGKRVLVTSQKSPALQVLQEQLPAPVRPLAVSLLDSDREGLREFRASVDLIAERLQGIRRSDMEAEIAGLMARIDGLHRQLAQTDHEIERLGRDALQPIVIEGQSLAPVDAAMEVLEAGNDAMWIEDAITPAPVHDPIFTNDEIAGLRQSRAAVGALISYLGVTLPPADLLDDVDEIVTAHADLMAAAHINLQIDSGATWALADPRPEHIGAVERLSEWLAAWTQRRDDLARAVPAWDPAIEDMLAAPSDPTLAAIRALADQARALADDYAWLLTRPIELPDGALDDPRFVAAVRDLGEGGSGLGFLQSLFARTTKQQLAAVRLTARPPATAEEWQAVSRHIDALRRARAFTSSWNHACAETKLPLLTIGGIAAGRQALNVIDRIDELADLASQAADLTRDLRHLLKKWSGSIDRNYDATAVANYLQVHIERNRLNRAEAIRSRLLAALGSQDSELHNEVRALTLKLGTEQLTKSELREQVLAWAGRLKWLHALAPQFVLIESVSSKVHASGATRWADRLRTAAATGEDNLCPGDWSRRWRLRRLAVWLDASQNLDRFRSLHRKRQQAEADLSRVYVRLIEQRTWLALKQQASPAVLAALSAYAVAVGRIGKGTGKSANRHRKTARAAANAVKGALPCWIMPHHRVSESLPAELGIFDLVIVDEASQSTLSALPALFRGRQILVVGDDKQVSPDHVGLDAEKANTRANRYLAAQVPLFISPMREEASLYDLASVVFGGDNLMLREHFRCAAPIIEFSKRQFYRSELRPLRLSKASERLDPPLIDVRVTNGYRKGKTNPPEADFIVDELERMGSDPAFAGRSLGVTTLLGTEQAALIYSMIESRLGISFIERFNVRVGDPAAFQGDERDIMVLSMVAAGPKPSALSGLPYEQRFNVAASRARERMILVRSIDLEQLSPKDGLRRALVEHFQSPFPHDQVDQADARARCESGFERDMFDALTEQGYSIETQVKVGAYRIDMVVEGDDDRRLAIECDGDRYHGPEQWPADMARQRTLERAGWRIWRCFASRFVRNRELVLRELFDLLDELDIKPRAAQTRSRIYTEYREWPPVEDLHDYDPPLVGARVASF